MTSDLSDFVVRSDALLPLDGLDSDENRENIIVEVICNFSTYIIPVHVAYASVNKLKE